MESRSISVSFFTKKNGKETIIAKHSLPHHPLSRGLRVPPRCRLLVILLPVYATDKTQRHMIRASIIIVPADAPGANSGSFTSQTVALEPTENSKSSFYAHQLAKKKRGEQRDRRCTVIESQYLYTIITLKRIQSVKKNRPSM
jgi:hypothetical protein